jgi:hypothetical protein
MSARFPVSRPLPAQADRRRSDRKRVMREAVLLTEDAEIIAECMLEDLSASGARLRAPARVGLSPKFLLWDGIAKNLCACELVWRTANCVGVRVLTRGTALQAAYRSKGAARERLSRLTRGW